MLFKLIFTPWFLALPFFGCAQVIPDSLAYFSQSPPGLTPEIFAPGIISKEDEFEFGSVFTADGTEFFYAVNVNNKAEIRYTKLANSQWTAPERIIYHDQYGYNDPFLSPDEQKLYFISKQPLNKKGAEKDYDLWYAEKQTDGWSEPINAGRTVNSDSNEYYISFTDEEKLYFASNIHATQRGDYDIYASQHINGQFQTPQRLSDSVNTPNYEADVFVAYDESYLIYCGERKGGFGRGDLYISFRKSDGSWTTAQNMGDAINTLNYEFCPFVTKDGKYLFYSSNQDIYWVSAKVIDQFRK